MEEIKFISQRQQETIFLGKKIGSAAKPGDIICLSGDLGSGKTTFVKGLAQGLKISASSVNSPTFVLLNIYDGKFPLYHFDLYRLEDVREILALGYEEYLRVEFEHRGGDQRLITISAKGGRYSDLRRVGLLLRRFKETRAKAPAPPTKPTKS